MSAPRSAPHCHRLPGFIGWALRESPRSRASHIMFRCRATTFTIPGSRSDPCLLISRFRRLPSPTYFALLRLSNSRPSKLPPAPQGHRRNALHQSPGFGRHGCYQGNQWPGCQPDHRCLPARLQRRLRHNPGGDRRGVRCRRGRPRRRSNRRQILTQGRAQVPAY